MSSSLRPYLSMVMEDTTGAKFQDQDLQVVSQAPEFHSGIIAPNIRIWQSMIAGSLAGSVENIAMSPVYTVRRYIHIRSFLKTPDGFSQAFRLIIQMMRPSVLYHRTWTLAIRPPQAVYFSFYEVSKELLSAGNPNNSVAHAFSGVFAAVSSGLVSTPMDMVNTRLLYGKEKYRGVWDCVKTVTLEEGLGAFYASYRTRIMTYGPYSAVNFAAYEAAKRRLMDILSERDGWLVHATAGAVAGGVAAAVTRPLYKAAELPSQCVSGYHHSVRVSFSHMLRLIVKYEGIRGLFRGSIHKMLLHAPATAISWSTYEAAKSFFQDLNGNSSTV